MAIGALTRRAGGQVVVAPDAPLPRRTEAFLGGEWRGARMGVTTGSGGSEALVRFWWLTRLCERSARRPRAWRRDGRLPRARPLAGGAAVDRVQHRRGAGGGPQGRAGVGLRGAVHGGGAGRPAGCGGGAGERLRRLGGAGGERGPSGGAGRAAGAGTGGRSFAGGRSWGPAPGPGRPSAARDGGALAARALPERDPLALRRAWALDVPQGGDSLPALYSADGRLPPEAVGRYLELAARAGAALTLDATALVAG